MDQNDQLFVQLLYLFHASAMQGMGKIKNPVTDKVERAMDQARQSIDMLEMLREKTKGNLSDDVARVLETFLTELRLNFVDEMSKDQTVSTQ